MNDAALAVAQRLWERYRVSEPATWAELEAVCRAREIALFYSQTLDTPGLYYCFEYLGVVCRTIILRRRGGVFELAHELFHDFIREERDDPSAPVVYAQDRRGGCDPAVHWEELAAREFALLVAGPPNRKPQKGEVGFSSRPERPVRAAEAPWQPRPPTPQELFEHAMLDVVLDFGPEVWELGRKLLPHITSAEEAAEAARMVWEAYDGAG